MMKPPNMALRQKRRAGVGVDTGAFLSDLSEMGLGVESVDYGYTAGSVLVRFTDGSEYQWPS
jgi:hypothetical protein